MAIEGRRVAAVDVVVRGDVASQLRQQGVATSVVLMVVASIAMTMMVMFVMVGLVERRMTVETVSVVMELLTL